VPFDFTTGLPTKYTILDALWLLIAIETKLAFEELDMPTHEKATCGEDWGEKESTANVATTTTTAPTALAIF
jgi:hypothetical protein